MPKAYFPSDNTEANLRGTYVCTTTDYRNAYTNMNINAAPYNVAGEFIGPLVPR